MVFHQISLFSGSPNEIITYSEKAIALSETELEKAESYQQLAQAYRLRGDLAKGLDYALQALKIYRQHDSKKKLGAIINTLATIYVESGDYEKAKHYFHLSIRINKEQKKGIHLAGDYNNLGEVYRVTAVYDSALYYFENAQQLYAENDFPLGRAYAIGNVGLVLAENDAFRAAERKINEAKKILTRLNDFYPIIVYNQYLAEIYQSKKQLDRAITISQENLQLAQEHGLKAQIRDLSKTLAGLLEQKGDHEQALLFQKQYMVFRDSILNEANIKKMAQLQSDYELGMKQAEIDLLNKEKSIQQLIVGALASILVLSSLLALIWYRNSRQKQYTNRLLLTQTSELQLQRDELEVLNSHRNKFLSIISHDLRGPVYAFNGLSKLIVHSLEEGDFAQLRDASEHLIKSADQLSSLLDNLLGWSLSQEGNFPCKPERVQLQKLCRDVLQIFQAMAHSKKIMLSADVADNLVVWADYNSLTTIIRNLLSNALKFTEEGGQVSLIAYGDKQQVVLMVVDTGMGISSERLKKLFELRDEKRTWGTAGEKGLGLGLRLAFEFTKMNGGQLEVSSTEGEGSTFSLKLPVPEPQEETAVIA